MKMGASTLTGIADRCNNFPPFDFLAAFDQNLLAMGIFGHFAIPMVNHHQVAEIHLSGRIGHLAVGSGDNFGPGSVGNIKTGVKAAFTRKRGFSISKP